MALSTMNIDSTRNEGKGVNTEDVQVNGNWRGLEGNLIQMNSIASTDLPMKHNIALEENGMTDEMISILKDNEDEDSNEDRAAKLYPANIRAQHQQWNATPSTTGRWTEEEQDLFIHGLAKFGKDWKKITASIPTRTLMQIRTHAQKYFKKLERAQAKTEIDPNDISIEESRWALNGNGDEVFADLNLDQTSEKRKKEHKVGSRRSRSQSVPAPDEDGQMDSDPLSELIIDKKAKPMRSGRWTKEEEDYANRLIQEFDDGTLPIPDGTMLRLFLGKALNCDPMRISKKFVGNSAIGKQVYKKNQEKIDSFTSDQIAKTRRELAVLERKFMVASNQVDLASVSKRESCRSRSHYMDPSIKNDERYNLDPYHMNVDHEALHAANMILNEDYSGCDPIHSTTKGLSMDTTTHSSLFGPHDNTFNLIYPQMPMDCSQKDAKVVPVSSYAYSQAFIPPLKVVHPTMNSNRRNSAENVERRNVVSIEDISEIRFSEEGRGLSIAYLFGEFGQDGININDAVPYLSNPNNTIFNLANNIAKNDSSYSILRSEDILEDGDWSQLLSP